MRLLILTGAPKYRSYSAVHLNESNHGGEDVAVYAVGPFAHLFHGLHEQSYVAHVISYATCIGRYKKAGHCSNATSGTMETKEITSFTLASTSLTVLSFLILLH